MRSLSDVLLAVATSRTALQARFAALDPREQRWWQLVVGMLVLILLFGFDVLPAVRSLRASALAQQQATTQLQVLQRLQACSQTLPAQPMLAQVATIKIL
jgi:Sec-independent protein translocase protein TatA